MNNKLLKFINNSPTSFHTVLNIKQVLSDVGFEEISEGREWNFQKGKGYFFSRNKSSLIAF